MICFREKYLSKQIHLRCKASHMHNFPGKKVSGLLLAAGFPILPITIMHYIEKDAWL